jgi:RimJ/RimL family protein N-acetyltransferase
MSVIERTPRIETADLTLRAPEARDAPRLARLMNDLDIARMTSRIPHPYGIEDAEDFVVRARGVDPTTDCNLLIEHEQWGVVGGLGLNTPPAAAPEVGYWIGKPWWGRGVASEALAGALAWAAGDWRKRYVTAGHFADNPASGSVLIKAGFLYTGDVQWRPSLARGELVATRMMVWLA